MRRLLVWLALAGVLFAAPAWAGHSVRTITDQSAVVMTATVTGTARYVADYSEALVWINVTAESGTVTLDVTVEVAPTDDGPWVTHPSGTFTQITAVGSAVKALENIGPWMRLKYTIGGSTSMTVSSYIALKD